MSSTVADAAAARLAAVRARIADAAARYGRDAADITLIAVSKTHSAAAVDALAALGQRDFGENYLQEALEKIATLAARPLVWHFIGQLQSNKTRAVAEHFAWAHTIDRAKLADRLSAQRPATLPALQVCVQVHLGDEANKGGVSPAELPALLDHVAACPRLQLRGLMAIPPEESSTDAQRRWFAALRTLFEAARVRHPGLDTLSMGMSADLDAAIAEGATQLRIGTALFGPRGATAHAN
jgi:pyridoxal phosphate enzyme (YggS family)